MTSKLKTDILETVSGSGTIALNNQLSGMTAASVPLLDHTKMPAGSVVQMVSTQLTSAVASSSTNYFTIAQLNITPTSTTSTIIVEFTGVFYKNNTSSGTAGASRWRLLRDNAPAPAMSANSLFYLCYTDGSIGYMTNGTLRMLDSPSSTSSVTYTIQGLTYGAALHVYNGATMTLTEIKG